MSTRIWDRIPRVRVLAAAVTLSAAVLFVVGLVGFGVPDVWWPQTGEAFAASLHPTSPPRHDDPCDLVAGPAKDYCNTGVVPGAAPAPNFDALDAWMILPPVAGLLLLGVWRISWARRR
ncbi:hypothetical protein ACFQVC_32850 [Streptomyces monticola]|uniref:Uncharacterized protein n=1 Tax=Streptomyces monticola TaxID=2666263 RepID=A0ABW2JSM1_9ACTN